jgi:hypothetical protein
MNLLFAIASLLLFPVAALPASEPPRCAETGIQVPDWSTEERDRVCSGSAAAIAFLRAAGLVYHVDDLTIRPLPPADAQEGQPLIGCCNMLRNEILVLTYDAAVVASRKYPSAFDMPMSPALWQSFVSHETAHAVAEQNFEAGVRRPTASEYIAGVVQLATLPADLRKVILDHYDAKGFGNASEISMLSYQLDPAVFAVMAYRHYAALGDRGPAFIARLLREGLDQ